MLIGVSNSKLEALVKSLDRKEDNYLFSKDVLITHPQLAEDYTRMCPVRCDLATAAVKASTGMYSGDAALTTLRADVQLMVDNCIRFNGADSAYGVTAQRFAEFSKQTIDAFIATHLCPADPSHEDLVALIHQLNRKEDRNEFAVDVTVAYPDLKERYIAVCPQVMCLERMLVKARNGEYDSPDSDTGSVWGNSVATSLVALRHDVELIVRNCLTFNAGQDIWIKRAQSFHRFAHRTIDDFVIRRVHALRGTLTGVQMFVSSPSLSERSGLGTAPRSSSENADTNVGGKRRREHTHNSSVINRSRRVDASGNDYAEKGENMDNRHSDGQVLDVHQTTLSSISGSRLQEKEEEEEGQGGNQSAGRKTVEWDPSIAAQAPHNPAASFNYAGGQRRDTGMEETTELVTPHPLLSPVQPVIRLPGSIRHLLVSDHLHRETLRLRRIGVTVDYTQWLSDPLCAIFRDFHRTAADSSSAVNETFSVTQVPLSSPTARYTEEQEDALKEVEREHNDVSAEGEEGGTASSTAPLCVPAPTEDSVARSIEQAVDEQPPSFEWTSSYSANALLVAFERYITALFSRQREKTIVDNAFCFSVDEEQVYHEYIRTIRTQFNRLFLNMLLYEREAVDAREVQVSQGLSVWFPTPLNSSPPVSGDGVVAASKENTPPTGTSSLQQPLHNASHATTEWLDLVHYSYLIRLLVQMPQIASLCCCDKSERKTHPVASADLEGIRFLPSSSASLLSHIRVVTEELLDFCDAYDQFLRKETTQRLKARLTNS